MSIWTTAARGFLKPMAHVLSKEIVMFFVGAVMAFGFYRTDTDTHRLAFRRPWEWVVFLALCVGLWWITRWILGTPNAGASLFEPA